MLMLAEKEYDKGPNTAIDTFFQSLATDQRQFAIAVLLSGTGTDGTRGIEAIKNNGGFVIVQDPETARFDGMPKSAISSGYADLVVSPEDVFSQAENYIDGILPQKNPPSEKFNEYVQQILGIVHRKTGYDFTQYKKPTIFRRITRRIQMLKLNDIEKYQEYILKHEEEAGLLTKEFFIGVTNFFRDKDAFNCLNEQVIFRIIDSKEDNDPLKVWITACSTGQEAYSVAIMIDRALQQLNRTLDVKIFASDIDKTAVEFAARGRYQHSMLMGLEKKILQQYFTETEDGMIIIPRIRKQVVFATHDITKDPPFIRNDLVTCRNLLIYLNPAVQENVLSTLHFALNPGGFLFLGTSENPALTRKGFAEINNKWKIYQRTTDQNSFARGLVTSGRNQLSSFTGVPVPKSRTDNQLSEDLIKVLADKLGYAAVYINENYEIKDGIGNFKKYLSLPDKLNALSILKMAPVELSGILSAALRKCLKENKSQTIHNVRVTLGDQRRLIDLFVYPPKETSNGMYSLVVFGEGIAESEKMQIPVQDMTLLQKDQYVIQLEEELRETRTNLQMAIENLETANEELQSSNEELQSANEELQSSNEELQSLNEELHTLNTEHQLRIKELVELNDDISNYLQTSQIAQIFLDQKLRIRRFNNSASAVFNLIEGDIGRPIDHVTHHIKASTFSDDVKRVSKTGTIIEREIEVEGGSVFLLRVLPYIRQDKVRDGLVITMVDISATKNLNTLIKSVFEASANPIFVFEAERNDKEEITDFVCTIANYKAYTGFGRQQKEDNLSLKKDFPELAIPQLFEKYIDVIQSGRSASLEFTINKNGSKYWYLGGISKTLGGFVLVLSDFTLRKDAEDKLRKNYEELLGARDTLQEKTRELRLLNEKLEASNADLMQFASVASHDLKEPLRKIHFFTGLIKDEFSNVMDGNLSIYIDRILNSSSRATNLINDVLSYSRLSSENLLEKVDLNHIVTEILQDLDLVINEKKAIVEVGNLPVIQAVAGQMRQLFQNIIANSLKFHKPNQPPVITITSKMYEKNIFPELKDIKGRMFEIRIKDEGIGFDEQYSRKIFSLFQRLNSKEQYEGTGIGLAIASKIVERHHGIITAKGRENDGAEFIIVLPEKQPEHTNRIKEGNILDQTN
jgi:two-component system CheB/CheR fusion protein